MSSCCGYLSRRVCVCVCVMVGQWWGDEEGRTERTTSMNIRVIAAGRKCPCGDRVADGRDLLLAKVVPRPLFPPNNRKEMHPDAGKGASREIERHGAGAGRRAEGRVKNQIKSGNEREKRENREKREEKEEREETASEKRKKVRSERRMRRASGAFREEGGGKGVGVEGYGQSEMGAIFGDFWRFLK